MDSDKTIFNENFARTETPSEIQKKPLLEINLEEIQKENYIENESALRQEVYSCLLRREKDQATEILSSTLKSITKFYATQFDEANEIYYYQDGITKPEGRTYIKAYCRKILEEAYTEQLANRVIAKIEADSYVEQKNFLKRHYLNEIATKNGILNILTKEVLPYSSQKIFFNKINAFYNPNAKCPKIDAFFKEILPDENDVKTLYEIFGYCLIGGYPIQKIILFIGEGGNGKGQALELLRQFIGPENYSAIQLQNFERSEFKEAELFNKLANIGADISDQPLKTTAKIKGLSGGDSVSASRKFKQDMVFTNEAKLIFSANKLPKTYDLTHAFFRRWIYLVFPYKFLTTEEINSLSTKEKEKAKIKKDDVIKGLLDEEEKSGLLNEALSGLDRLLTQGTFTSSQTSEKTKDWWVRESDSFLAFCWEKLETAESELEFIRKDDLRRNYQKFCKEHRLVAEGDQHIHEIMTREVKAWESRLSTEDQERVWKGVKFKTP